MKKMLIAAAFICAAAAFAAEIKIDFNAAAPWKAMRNHGQRLKFETKEVQGKKATVVTPAPNPKNKGTDTAFSLATDKFSVKGKKTVTVKFSFLATKGMSGFTGGGWWCTAVHWYDAANKDLPKSTTIALPAATGAFQTVTKEVAVPANAASAYVHFGFDYPNIDGKKSFAITDVTVTY